MPRQIITWDNDNIVLCFVMPYWHRQCFITTDLWLRETWEVFNHGFSRIFTDFGYARLGSFFNHWFSRIFTDFWLRIGVVRAVVSGSVKSGKSVDNKKRGALRASMIRFFYLLILLILLIFGYAILGGFFNHGFSLIFTDFCYASVGYVRLSRVQLNQENQ